MNSQPAVEDLRNALQVLWAIDCTQVEDEGWKDLLRVGQLIREAIGKLEDRQRRIAAEFPSLVTLYEEVHAADRAVAGVPVEPGKGA